MTSRAPDETFHGQTLNYRRGAARDRQRSLAASTVHLVATTLAMPPLKVSRRSDYSARPCFYLGHSSSLQLLRSLRRTFQEAKLVLQQLSARQATDLGTSALSMLCMHGSCICGRGTRLHRHLRTGHGLLSAIVALLRPAKLKATPSRIETSLQYSNRHHRMSSKISDAVLVLILS